MVSRRSESVQAFQTRLDLIIGLGEEFFLKAEIIWMQVWRSSYEIEEDGLQGPPNLF